MPREEGRLFARVGEGEAWQSDSLGCDARSSSLHQQEHQTRQLCAARQCLGWIESVRNVRDSRGNDVRGSLERIRAKCPRLGGQ